MTKNTKDTQRADWIEPEVTSLDIDETEGFPVFGSDSSIFPDCTHS